MKLFLLSHARFFSAFGLGAISGLDLLITHQDQLNQIIGAIVVIVTVGGGLIHDYEIKRAELEAQNPKPVTAVLTTTTS